MSIIAVIDYWDNDQTMPASFVRSCGDQFQAVSDCGEWVIGNYASCEQALRAVWRDRELWDQAQRGWEQ